MKKTIFYKLFIFTISFSTFGVLPEESAEKDENVRPLPVRPTLRRQNAMSEKWTTPAESALNEKKKPIRPKLKRVFPRPIAVTPEVEARLAEQLRKHPVKIQKKPKPALKRAMPALKVIYASPPKGLKGILLSSSKKGSRKRLHWAPQTRVKTFSYQSPNSLKSAQETTEDLKLASH